MTYMLSHLLLSILFVSLIYSSKNRETFFYAINRHSDECPFNSTSTDWTVFCGWSGVDGSPNSAVYLNGNLQYLRTFSAGTKSVSLWVKLDTIYGQPTPNVLLDSNRTESMPTNYSVGPKAVSAENLGMYVMGFGAGGCGSSFLLVMNSKDGGAGIRSPVSVRILESVRSPWHVQDLRLRRSVAPYGSDHLSSHWHLHLHRQPSGGSRLSGIL